MSVIVGKVFLDKIVMCADSIVVRNWEMKDTSGNFLKIKRINDMVVGGCGTANELSLLYCFMKTHKPGSASEQDIMVFFSEFVKYLKDFDVNAQTIKNSYLMIFGGKMFLISDGFLVVEIKDYTAIGAGEAYALAALHMGASPEKAVRIACDLSCYVAEPIVTEVVKIEQGGV